MGTILQPHPDPGDRPAWFCTQLGLIFLPLLPLIGGFFLVVSSAQATARHWQEMRARPVNRGLALLGLLMILVSFLAEYPGEALLGLPHFLPYFWVVAAQSEITGRPQQLRRLATLLLCSVGVLVPIGLGELYLGWGTPPILGGLLPWPFEPFGTPPGRMSSLLSYANNLALYLTVTFSLGLGLWCASWQRWRSLSVMSRSYSAALAPHPSSGTSSGSTSSNSPEPSARSTPKQEGFTLLLWTGLLLLNGLGLLLTQSRSAWGLAALSAVAAACYLRWKFLVAAVFGWIGAIFWAAFGPIGKIPLRQVVPAFFWARLTDQNFPDRPLPTLRSTQWQFTLDLIRERPLQGWGLRNFSPLYEAKTQVWMGHPHNLFLMLGAEIGLPLTLILITIMGWICYRASRYFFSPKHLKSANLQSNSLSDSLQIKIVDHASHCIFGAFLLSLINVTLFHGFDILLFDFRINAMAWILVSQILGELYLSSVGNLSLRRSGMPDTPDSKPRFGLDSDFDQ